MTDETQDETVMARARADLARAREAMRQDRDAAAEDLLGADGRGFDRGAFHLRDGYYPSEWSRLK